MNSLLHKLTLFVRYISDTHKPVICELHYSKHIIDDHDLMMLTWVFGKKYNVSVEGVKTKYFSKHGTAMIPMPVKGDCVRISIKNLWRKKRIMVPILKTFIDGTNSKPLKNFVTLIGQPVHTANYTLHAVVTRAQQEEPVKIYERVAN